MIVLLMRGLWRRAAAGGRLLRPVALLGSVLSEAGGAEAGWWQAAWLAARAAPLASRPGVRF